MPAELHTRRLEAVRNWTSFLENGDDVATRVPDLAAALGAEFVPLGPRSHTSAITARRFKEAATGFLAG